LISGHCTSFCRHCEERSNPEAALSDLACLFSAGNATLACGYENFAFQAILKPYFAPYFYYKTTLVAEL